MRKICSRGLDDSDELAVWRCKHRGHTINSKHTPGPWYTAKWKHSVIPFGVQSEGTGNICEISMCCVQGMRINKDKQIEIVNANAYLIAAAPELLEAANSALSLLCTVYQNGVAKIKIEQAGDVIGSLKSAIAKAEGRI